MILDTGATAQLMKTTVNNLLAHQRASDLEVQAAFGTRRKRAAIHGQARMYILNTSEPEQRGTPLEHSVDTLDDLNDDLFSMVQYYEDMHCDIHLVHDGFSGIRGTDPRTGHKIEIPARYDPGRKAWLIDYVIAKDMKTAREAGRALENALARDTPRNRAAAARTFIADDDIALALTLIDGTVTLRDNDVACLVNMTELRELCAPTPDAEAPSGGAADTADAADCYLHDDGKRQAQLQAGFKPPSYNWTTLPPPESASSRPKVDGKKLEQRRYQQAVCPEVPAMHNGLSCTAEARSVPASTAATAAENNDTLRDNGRDSMQSELDRLQALEDEMDDKLFRDTDCNLAGPKMSMGSAERKMSLAELHRRKGHAGYLKGCPVCLMCRKNVRKRHAIRDPPTENRTGYRWSIDGLTWPHKSRNGNKFTLVMRDFASGYYMVLHIQRKSDSVTAVEKAITALRADPRFHDADRGYDLVSELHLDPAGEWRDDAAVWQQMCKTLGIHCVYGDPTHKRSMAFAENAVKQIELGTKYIMAENSLPIEWFEFACDQAAQIRNLLPLNRDMTSGDGDAVRPSERLSQDSHGRAKISRRTCDKIMQHMITVGTPCLVTIPNTKGSDIVNLARTRWGIMHHMLEDMPVFECPWTGSQFRSKSYHAAELPHGVSAYEWLGLPIPPLPKLSFQRQGDLLEVPKTVVQLDGLGKFTGDQPALHLPATKLRSEGAAEPLVTTVDKHGRVYVPDANGVLQPTDGMLKKMSDNGIIPPVEANTDPHARVKSLLHYSPDWFIGKDVYKNFPDHGGVYHGIVSSTRLMPDTDTVVWRILYDDKDTEDYTAEQMVDYCILRIDGTRAAPAQAPAPAPSATVQTAEPQHESSAAPPPTAQPGKSGKPTEGDTAPDIPRDSDLFRDVDVYSTLDDQTFFDVCKSIGLASAQWKAYYEYIGEHFYRGHTWRGVEGAVHFLHPWGGAKSQSRFKPGEKFPIPSGEHWEKMMRLHKLRSNDSNTEYVNAKLAIAAELETLANEQYITKLRRLLESDDELETAVAAAIVAEAVGDMSVYTDAAGKIKPPRNLREALSRPDSELWKAAMEKEMASLDKLEVISKGHTLTALKKRGIRKRPVPIDLIYDVKYHPDGAVDKYKVRCVQKGHAGNLIKGIHYNETFSSSPKCETTRLLQALRVLNGWTSCPFDICTAYLHADTRPEEQYPIRYPEGLRQYDPETGEELYGLLEKNLYGSPVASRRFSQMRDEWILKTFNQNGWTAKQMGADPCLFKLTSPKGKHSYMLIHTDDCDLVCESAIDAPAITSLFDKRFGIKLCDPAYMLGVNRKITTLDDGSVTLEMTQPDFIESMYHRWRDFLPRRQPTCPFPAKEFLSLSNPDGEPANIPDSEVEEVLALGYQQVVGELLWATRNTGPDTAYGVQQLCTVMSRPSKRAWKAAMHMVYYLYGQRNQGIMFNSNGNTEPICYYDSSDKGDPSDQRASGGYVIMLAGGPIAWSSRKHRHVGRSSSHNEYMALASGAQELKWVRDLLKEMGFADCVRAPSPILGDNDQATRWSIERMVTTGNKCIRTDYHWIKECVQLGDICPRRVSTENNISDLFTKSLSGQNFTRLREILIGRSAMPALPPPPHR